MSEATLNHGFVQKFEASSFGVEDLWLFVNLLRLLDVVGATDRDDGAVGEDPATLEERRQALMTSSRDEIDALQASHGLQAITELVDEAETRIRYPVLKHPVKVKSFNLDKTPLVEGTLEGIKGQYLIFDTGVINMRKYGGYNIAVSGE